MPRNLSEKKTKTGVGKNPTKTKKSKNERVAVLAEKFIEWEENVQQRRSKLWGYRYAERHGTAWDGSFDLVEYATNKCLGDYDEAKSLGIGELYRRQYFCRRCNNLNDSKYKPYCTECTEAWKASAAAKAKSTLTTLIANHIASMDNDKTGKNP